jgi:hypothetical protein
LGNPKRAEFFKANDDKIQEIFGTTKGSGLVRKIIEQTPVWFEVGKYKINNRLLERQQLSVKYHSGASIPFFPKVVPISDAFTELLTTLCESKRLDKRILKDLDVDEKRMAETLVVKGGMGKQLGVSEVSPTDDDAKKIKRFEIVKGSYEAGNSSKEVIEELRGLILYFIKTHRIGRKDGLASLEALH